MLHLPGFVPEHAAGSFLDHAVDLLREPIWPRHRDAGSAGRTSAGIDLAVICVGGAAPPRIVTREVSPRLGRRVPAQCLELPLEALLEALTNIVSANRDESLVTFEADDGGRSICWSDAMGRHRLSIAAPGQVAPLPAGVAGRANLVWRVDVAGRADVGALLAAMPAFVPSAPVAADEPGQSVRRIAPDNTAGGWAQLELEEPRRG